MGLDVYVGTFTRYLVGDWELASAQVARELGVELEIVRAEPEPEDTITDPDVVRDAVLEWRNGLAGALGTELSWSEADAMPYVTDKPSWSSYSALLLLAAHDEHPELPLPEQVPDDPSTEPLLRAVLPEKRKGLLRRARGPDEPPRYFALYTPEVWLPCLLESAWKAPFVTGQEMVMSSVETLHAQLRELARSHDEALESWRATEPAVESTLELGDQSVELLAAGSLADEAYYALDMLLRLTEAAVEHRLPVKLDY